MSRNIVNIKDVRRMYGDLNLHTYLDDSSNSIAVHMMMDGIDATIIQTAHLLKDDVLYFITTMPDLVPEDTKEDVKSYLTKVNHNMILGCFDLYPEGKQVSFRSSLYLDGLDFVSKKTFGAHVHLGFNAFRDHGRELRGVFHGRYDTVKSGTYEMYR